jgi:hypothetical protein
MGLNVKWQMVDRKTTSLFTFSICALRCAMQQAAKGSLNVKWQMVDGRTTGVFTYAMCHLPCRMRFSASC